MSIRQETITYGSFQAPAGTVVDHIFLSFTEAQGLHQVQPIILAPDTQPSPVTLEPGAYTASAQAIDAKGNPIGNAAIDTFLIEAPVTLSIPVTLTGTTS